jgi:hypothetical protein
LFGHRRSTSRARRIEGVWYSRCRRCGIKLVRLRKSKWLALDQLDPAAEPPDATPCTNSEALPPQARAMDTAVF